jgi:hypothetical protein
MDSSPYYSHSVGILLFTLFTFVETASAYKYTKDYVLSTSESDFESVLINTHPVHLAS